MQRIFGVLAIVGVIALSLFLLKVMPGWLFRTIVAIAFGPIIVAPRVLGAFGATAGAQVTKNGN